MQVVISIKLQVNLIQNKTFCSKGFCLLYFGSLYNVD